MSKKIGIVCRMFNDTVGITKPYINFFQRFGEIRLVSALENTIHEDLDLLVLPGGPDVDASRYNSKVNVYQGRAEVLFEAFDQNLLTEYIRRDQAIFGICRGMQSLSVTAGASMNQHIVGHPTSITRTDLVHNIKATNPFTNQVFDIPVNSIHHQSVNIPVSLNNYIVTLGTSALENKVHLPHVEAIHIQGTKAVGVQYHPEEIHDEYSISLINSLLNLE